MSLLQQKKDFSKRGIYDELFTPEIAVMMILGKIPLNFNKVWEPTSEGTSNITKILNCFNYDVIETHKKNGFDFLTSKIEFDYDIIITNPPYSLKNQFLKRAFEIDKPFMFLLPLTTLESEFRNKLFRYNEIQLLIPSKRFNFKSEKKSSAWFQTSWFCCKCNLPNQLNFISI